MTRPMVLLLSLVAACSTNETAPERACDSAANDDPAVKALIIKGVGNPYFQSNSQDELNAAKQDARLACLRSRGLAPKGGVERQKPL